MKINFLLIKKWFEEKQHQIENLDQQLKKLHTSIDALIHHRKELTSTTGQFSKSIAMLGNCEVIKLYLLFTNYLFIILIILLIE